MDLDLEQLAKVLTNRLPNEYLRKLISLSRTEYLQLMLNLDKQVEKKNKYRAIYGTRILKLEAYNVVDAIAKASQHFDVTPAEIQVYPESENV